MTIEKRFVGRKPNTRLALTDDGRERIARHWEQLDRLRETARRAPVRLAQLRQRRPSDASPAVDRQLLAADRRR